MHICICFTFAHTCSYLYQHTFSSTLSLHQSVRTDPIQRLHALHNLHTLLTHPPGGRLPPSIPRTLRDDALKVGVGQQVWPFKSLHNNYVSDCNLMRCWSASRTYIYIDSQLVHSQPTVSKTHCKPVNHVHTRTSTHSQEEADAIRRKYLGQARARLEAAEHEAGKALRECGLGAAAEAAAAALTTTSCGSASTAAAAPPASASDDAIDEQWLHDAVHLLTAGGKQCDVMR